MTAKRRTFSNGYKFRNFEGQPQDTLVQTGVPARVVIPMKQGFGAEVAPVVEVGQTVAAGQVIGIDDESVSSPVHSSANGKVAAIGTVEFPDGEMTAVTIEADGSDDWQMLEGFSANWQNLPAEMIDNLIYLSGAGATGNAGIPTTFKSSVIGPDEVEDVIIHGLAAEVYNPSLTALLKGEKLSHLADGIKILKKAMPNAKLHVALDESQTGLAEELSKLLADDAVEICTVESKYPAHFDEILVPTVLEREFPHGFSAANIGVIVLDAQAVLHVYEAVAEGKPVIERTVALCGGGFGENPHVKARIGTPLEYIVEGRAKQDTELRFIRNSVLTGQTLSDMSAPMDRTFTSIIALPEGTEREFMFFLRPGANRDSFSNVFLSAIFKGSAKMCNTNLHGEGRPCIFCTYCQQACPVGIIPHLLFHHVNREMIDETLLNYEIFKCIECNLCSYVCTSKISLGKSLKDGKQKLIEEGLSCPKPAFALKGVEEQPGTE